MTRSDSSGRMHPGLAIALALIAFLVLFLNLRGCWFPNMGLEMWRPRVTIPGLGWHHQFYGLLGLWGLIQIGLAIWVGFDADRRGQNGWLWGLLVFFTGIVGLVVYLIVIPALATRDGAADAGPAAAVTGPAPPPAPAVGCPACGRELRPDFALCPYCGRSLACKECGQRVEADWKVCPRCAAPLESGGPAGA